MASIFDLFQGMLKDYLYRTSNQLRLHIFLDTPPKIALAEVDAVLFLRQEQARVAMCVLRPLPQEIL